MYFQIDGKHPVEKDLTNIIDNGNEKKLRK